MLSKQQQEFFAHSKVCQNGELIPMYHGTTHVFDSFDPKFTGKGNDQYGSGFYFTSSYDNALGYTSPKDGSAAPDGPILETYLNITNPLYVDATKNESISDIMFSVKQTMKIMKYHPDLYRLPDDEETMNPMGDYSESFYNYPFKDKTFFSSQNEYKKQFYPFIEDLVHTYFPNGANYRQLDIFFGENGTCLREALMKECNLDGVIIRFKNCINAVAWFPEQIKDVRNRCPQMTPYLMDRAIYREKER